MNVLGKIWFFFDAKNKKYFCLIILLSILVSALEVLTIGALVPFLIAFSDPLAFFEKYDFLDEIAFLKMYSNESIRSFMAVAFIVIISMAAVIKVVHLWVVTYFSELNAGKLVGEMFKSVSMDEYQFIEHVILARL